MCDYLQERNGHNKAKEYISDLRVYCKKIVPFVYYYREQISSFNCTAHNILRNEISLILSKLPKIIKEKRGIITLLITGFIGLAYEGISSFLHNVKVMENKVNIQHNKLIHLENSVVMYEVYNTEMLEKLINIIH